MIIGTRSGLILDGPFSRSFLWLFSIADKLPIPEKPVCIQEEDLKGLAFEPGEDTREAGERLAASYVNFYIANEAVLVPQFQDKHDKLACDILGKLFPDRRI
ncbi:MAG: hypothetical protein EGP66_01420, partial [Lachnospira sp.]|nr:hypothetical protein [Lachnospira sp.]